MINEISSIQCNQFNTKLKVIYVTIVDLYQKAKQMQNKLENENLTLEERQQLQTEINKISDKLCFNIKEYENLYTKTDNKLNASGLHGISQNFKARKICKFRKKMLTKKIPCVILFLPRYAGLFLRA